MKKKTSLFAGPRRSFLKQLSAGLVAGLMLPHEGRSKPEFPRREFFVPPLVNEKFWEMVKKQFAIPEGKIMANSANLCASPYFIHEKVNRLSQDLATDVSFQNRAKFNAFREEAIQLLAEYLGVGDKEICITRNTSEANNIVVNGLDFKPGDEVLIWNQNHPSNHIAWQHRAKRQGFTVKEISVPDNPKSSAELVATVAGSISSRTRLISFSHISNVSGLAMPAKEISMLAREKGILTLVDGAQTLGFQQINLKDIGCTFYTSSTHKWLMGPMENGLLYVDEAYQDQLWPNIIAAGWAEDYQTLDEKIGVLGQRNTPATAAIPDIVRFHQSIGPENVETRVRQLTNYLKDGIQRNIPRVEFVTPLKDELSGGVLIFRIPGKESIELFQKLYTDYGIATAPTGGIRISPHINCLLNDLDSIVEALTALSK